MKMSILLTQEALNRYENMCDAERYYEKQLAYYTKQAKICYKVLCRYFNDDENDTGQSIVPEEKCIEVLGFDKEEGSRVIRMMYELNITERQNGMVVI